MRVFLILLAVGIPGNTIAQSESEVKEMQVKAAYLYNFTKFIYWNHLDGAEEPATITLGLISADRIADIIEGYTKLTSKKPTIIIKRITAIDDELTSCQLLYIDQSGKEELPVILRKINGSPVITVSDIHGFANRGGMIGFYLEDGRIKIEINLSQVNQSGMEISAKLKEVARIIR
ncbi:MAG: YfiR family protein [Bacteroidales bacterium]|nr:YfiR family protein [Bacteroidales bacterium]